MYTSLLKRMGGRSNFRRSDSCKDYEMKTSSFRTGNALVSSVKTISEMQTFSNMSQLLIVPIQIQNNMGAPSAKQGTFYESQSETFDAKKDARSLYYKNQKSKKRSQSKSISKRAKTQKAVSNSHVKSTHKYLDTSSGIDFEHQSLVDALYPSGIIEQAKTTLVNMKLESNTSLLLEVLEVLGALSISLPTCKTPLQVASQLVLAIRAMTKGSITESIFRQSGTIDWCVNLFGYNVLEPQSSTETSDEWLKKLPKIAENWESIQGAPLFDKISNLISVAASIGLCNATNLTWSVKGVELFRVGNIKKHSTALDFFSAILDTTICFIEGGYECFKQESFRPLLFSSDEGREFDELYFPLIELHEHAMVFNLHDKPVVIKGVRQVLGDLEYGSLLDETIDLATRAFQSAKGTWQQSVLEKRLEILRRNRAAYNAKRIDGSLRYAPYSIYIQGKSGVGKSTIAQILMSDCLNASGSDPNSRFTATIKESDKFDSSLKGDTSGIYLDDMGNTKKEFLDKSPIERLIDINNNMITYANKADLHEKGKVEIRPKILVITSNAPLAVHAREGSICPFSGVRRADIHLNVVCKEEYKTNDGRLNKRKAMTDFPGDSLVNDIWDIAVKVPCDEPNGDMNLLADYDRNRPVMSIHDVLRVATTECVEHFDIQRRLVAKGENLVASRKYCPECRLAGDLCKCALEKQAFMGIDFDSIKSQFDQINPNLDNIVLRVPKFVINNPIVQFMYMARSASDFMRLEKESRKDFLSIYFCIMFLLFCSDNFSLGYVIIFTVFALSGYLAILAAWRDEKISQLAANDTITEDLFKSLRQSKIVQFFSVCVMGKLLYSFVMLMKTSHMVNQTALMPTSIDEIKKRDAESNPWATAEVDELHIKHTNDTMTHDQVVTKVMNNLFHAQFVENGEKQSCDILALGGTTYLMPLHVFEGRKEMKVLVTKKDPLKLNSTFKGFVSVATMVPVEGKDLCVVAIPSGGPQNEILDLFPDSCKVRGTGEMCYRTKDGVMHRDIIRITPADSQAGGPGYEYNCRYETFRGLCMATIVAKFAKSTIAGVHLRGRTGRTDGLALTVSHKELKDTIALAHTQWKSCFPSHVNGTFPTTRYDKQVINSRLIHPKSPINFLPLGSNVEFLGQTGARASYTSSKVMTTPISDAVHEITGVPNNYGPPQFHRTNMWQASLAMSANPGAGVEPTLIDMATLDYLSDIKEKFQSEDFGDMVRKEMRPLTDMQSLCGIDGKRFIDAMKRGTSAGFPLAGPKRDMITLLAPEDYPDFACPAEFDEKVMEERDRMEALLLKGERCYSIYKACVKDEPTKIGKEKVRVFQVIDVAMQMIIRSKFLPIVRMLSLFPVLTECAVGVNAQGPEWDQLAKHMKKFGEDRIFAGDYSKYDLRMPASLITAAFKVMIELAETCGTYTEDDITIMKGVATEVAYSCVAYNGDMIIHRGSNPSGQNLTVYVNCIVNSLLLRCGYYFLAPGNTIPEPFRENVAMEIYGDDVKGSVRKGCDWYNHISYASFLADRDMKFTMPDKTSTPTAYMIDSEADFLKRHNLYNPDTGLIHGTLDENSIFKSLHSVLQSSSVSALDQSAMNIDGALREWWQYGKDMYEVRRAEMRAVAEKCEITHMCDELDRTYEDRLVMFQEKYETQSKYDKQCGIEIPFNEDDHCLGTVFDRFFGFEKYLSYLTLPTMFIIWYLLVMEKIYFRYTGFDRRWLVFMMYGNLWSWLPWYMMMYFNTYFVPWCVRYLIWIWNAPVRQEEERRKRWAEADARRCKAAYAAWEARVKVEGRLD